MTKKRKGDFELGISPLGSADKSKRDPLKRLNKAWSKASKAEQKAFLAGIGVGQGGHVSSPPHEPARVLIANGRYLLPETIAEIERIMTRRGITPETVMGEIGFKGEGVTLARALCRGASLRLAIVAGIQKWLATPG